MLASVVIHLGTFNIERVRSSIISTPSDME